MTDDDIEIPAQNPDRDPHLLVMLHGAGSRPSALAAMAIAWQRRLRSARVLLPAGPHTDADGGRYWADPGEYPVSAASIGAAAKVIRARLCAERDRLDIPAERTVLVGLSQGASVGLELVFADQPVAGLFIGYAARLYRLPSADDRSRARVHLVHGALDTVVPLAHGEAASRRLRAIGADVTLDIQADEGHRIGQVQINAGTQAVMDWRFGRGDFAPKP